MEEQKRRAKNFHSLIGMKFSRLLVKEIHHTEQRFCSNGKKNGKVTYYLCQCDCGNHSVVEGRKLTMGKTKSCGCLKKEISAINGKESAHKTGEKLRKYSNIEKKLIVVLNSIINRCKSEKNCAYKNYGGRGICVCDDWSNKEYGKQKFLKWAFENGYKEGLTIERIDVNGNYSPENCRWATYKEQARNKRTNKIISLFGKNKCIAEIAENFGLKQPTLNRRWNAGDRGLRLIREVQ